MGVGRKEEGKDSERKDVVDEVAGALLDEDHFSDVIAGGGGGLSGLIAFMLLYDFPAVGCLFPRDCADTFAWLRECHRWLV